MKFTILVLLFISAFYVTAEKHDHWAVLVAGSNGFWNYRHQSDICHAYQIMKNNGIPEENIIVFAYDDIAQNSQNPVKGQIFNQPNGKDVYAGCKIDYKGADVNPTKFLQVITGQGEGKVLKSDSKSKVFINFSDHGAPGLIAFPSAYLYAQDFNTALHTMKSQNMYEKLTIYIEACESGSMFSGILDENINIYATTAANPDESSWAYYCHPNDVVNGVHIGSCLGDEYSISWMEDTDSADVCAKTLAQQFTDVQTRTKESHVMEYGFKGFKTEFIGNFHGTCDSKTTVESFLRNMKTKTSSHEEFARVDARYAKLEYLYNKFMRTHSSEDSTELEAELESMRNIEGRFASIRNQINLDFENRQGVLNFDCYRGLIDSYNEKCGTNEYDLKFFHHFATICNANMNSNHVANVMSNIC